MSGHTAACGADRSGLVAGFEVWSRVVVGKCEEQLVAALCVAHTPSQRDPILHSNKLWFSEMETTTPLAVSRLANFTLDI